MKSTKCREFKTAARLVTRSSEYDHITPLLQQLHWLPVSYRVAYKILLLVHNVRRVLCPGYVSELLQERKSSRALRSSSQGLLTTPTSWTKTYGDRAFSVCAPKLGNGLPNHVRNIGTLPLYKKNLETYLFSIFIDTYCVHFLNSFELLSYANCKAPWEFFLICTRPKHWLL